MMAQARRALREERFDDAQGILVNIVVREPDNDEAWVLLADTMQDPQRKLECLERARRIDPRNPAIQRAIQEQKTQLARAAFGSLPASPSGNGQTPDAHPDLATPLLEHADIVARQVLMTTDPAATRTLGLELVHLLERAIRYDERTTRRWAQSAGRAALVKYERAIYTLITNLPQNDPQRQTLREQRQRALEPLRTVRPTP